MSNCKLTGEKSIWPEDGDDSGDSMFLMDNNSLIKQIREVKENKERDIFLEDLYSPEIEEDMVENSKPSPGMVKVKYEDLRKKEKVAYILNEMKKYKKNDF